MTAQPDVSVLDNAVQVLIRAASYAAAFHALAEWLDEHADYEFAIASVTAEQMVDEPPDYEYWVSAFIVHGSNPPTIAQELA